MESGFNDLQVFENEVHNKRNQMDVRFFSIFFKEGINSRMSIELDQYIQLTYIENMLPFVSIMI